MEYDIRAKAFTAAENALKLWRTKILRHSMLHRKRESRTMVKKVQNKIYRCYVPAIHLRHDREEKKYRVVYFKLFFQETASYGFYVARAHSTNYYILYQAAFDLLR